MKKDLEYLTLSDLEAEKQAIQLHINDLKQEKQQPCGIDRAQRRRLYAERRAIDDEIKSRKKDGKSIKTMIQLMLF